MRRLVLLAMLLLPLAGCAGMMESLARGYPADDSWSRPLRARLHHGTGGLGIDLSSPAYVAVFEIVPGRGAGLFYPAYSDEASRFSSGFSHVLVAGPRHYDWYFRRNPASFAVSGPRHYLLVASRSPLRLDGLLDRPSALRSMMGYSRFSRMNADETMDDILSLVVPNVGDDDWTSDVLTVWPERPYRSSDAYVDQVYVTVVCRDGRRVVVPVDQGRRACGGEDGWRRPRPPPPAAGDTLDEERPGRDSVDVPTRRRPIPTDAPGGAGEGGEGSARRPVSRPPTEEPASGRERFGLREREEPRVVAPPAARPAPEEQGGAERPRREEPRAEQPRTERPRREEPRAAPREEPRVERPEPSRIEAVPTVRETPRVERPEPSRIEAVPTVRETPRVERPEPSPVEVAPAVRETPRVERPEPSRAEPAPVVREEPRPEPARVAPRPEPRTERPAPPPAPAQPAESRSRPGTPTEGEVR